MFNSKLMTMKTLSKNSKSSKVETITKSLKEAGYKFKIQFDKHTGWDVLVFSFNKGCQHFFYITERGSLLFAKTFSKNNGYTYTSTRHCNIIEDRLMKLSGLKSLY